MSQSESPDEGDEKTKKNHYSWWDAVFDIIFLGGEVFVWIIGGLIRGLAWLAAAVVTSCN